MKTPQPERRPLRVSSGSHSPSKIADIAPYRPFIQQIDLVFPSNPALLEAIQSLKTSYSKGQVKLSDVVQDQSDLLLVSHSQLEDDLWCIEPHANLALCISKDTYERLGLLGHKLPSTKHHHSGERYVIGIPLRKSAQSPKNMEKVRAALARWDEIRQADLGKDRVLWDVVYCSRSPSISISDLVINNAQIRHVECETREMCDVHVPIVSRTAFFDCPDRKQLGDSDALDDWNQRIQTIFEWVGMACLGAQRLFANDCVDPFVAIYEPPTPSYIGNVVCLQWKGLLPPEFVKQVLNVVTANLLTSSAPPFVAVTVHGFTNSPVSYLPQSAKEPADLFSPSRLPLKSPKEGGEDAWVLLITHAEPNGSTESPQTDGELKWCLMDSLG